MTQEEKELLLKDLCARLPYQPMCEFTDTEDGFCTATAELGYSLRDFISGKILIKPYLRPMSSMTVEERKEENRLWDIITKTRNDLHYLYTDFLLSRHLDYRGLIPIGLALEAPTEMYNIKN